MKNSRKQLTMGLIAVFLFSFLVTTAFAKGSSPRVKKRSQKGKGQFIRLSANFKSPSFSIHSDSGKFSKPSVNFSRPSFSIASNKREFSRPSFKIASNKGEFTRPSFSFGSYNGQFSKPSFSNSLKSITRKK